MGNNNIPVENKVKEIIHEVIEERIIDPSEEYEISLKDMDSISFIKLIVELENEYSIEFEDEMLAVDAFSSFDDIIEYIKIRIS